MVYRGDLVFNLAHYNAPIRDRPNLMIRASRFLLLPAVAELVLIATLFDADPNNLFIQSLFAVAVVIAFNVAMLAVLLPLTPFAEAVSPAVASRLERAAAVGSVTALLLATSLFVSVAIVGHYATKKKNIPWLAKKIEQRTSNFLQDRSSVAGYSDLVYAQPPSVLFLFYTLM